MGHFLFALPVHFATALDTVWIGSVSYITIDGLSFKAANNIVSGNVYSEATHLTIQNSESSWGVKHGFAQVTQSGDNVITGCDIHDNSGAGILNYKTAASSGHENYYKNNTIYNNNQFGIYIIGNYNIIENNTVYDNGNTSEMTVGIELFNGDNDGYGQHNIVRYNHIYGQKSGLNNGEGIDSDDYSAYNDIYYNIIHDNDGPGITVWKANHINIFNNTVYANAVNSGGALTTKAEIDITSDAADVNNVVVKNNIAQATRANTYVIYLDSNTYNSSGLNITNNIYYTSAANWYYWNSSGGNNLTTWNGFTGIGTDLNSAPYFVTGGEAKPYPNFYPRSYSPVINAGTDVSLTQDYLGVAVPQGATPDIGAFEYTVSIPENIWFFFPLFMVLPRLIFLLSKTQDRKLLLALLRNGRYQAILRQLYLPYLNLISSLTKRSN